MQKLNMTKSKQAKQNPSLNTVTKQYLENIKREVQLPL